MRNTSQLRSCTGGYTLIELLTVLVLVAVLTSMAVPSMTAFVQVNRTREALNTLAGDLGLARVLAIREGRRVTLRIDSPTQYTVAVSNSTVSKRTNLAKEYPGVQLQAVNLPDNQITFDSRGLTLSPGTAGARFVAQGYGVRDSLVITAVGRVYRAN